MCAPSDRGSDRAWMGAVSSISLFVARPYRVTFTSPSSKTTHVFASWPSRSAPAPSIQIFTAPGLETPRETHSSSLGVSPSPPDTALGGREVRFPKFLEVQKVRGKSFTH